MINEDLRHRRRLDLKVTGVVYRRTGHQDIHKKSEDENMGGEGKVDEKNVHATDTYHSIIQSNTYQDEFDCLEVLL